MPGRSVVCWSITVLGVLGGLLGLVAVIDPDNSALWAWVVAAVVILVSREAYARYVQDAMWRLDPLEHSLEEG